MYRVLCFSCRREGTSSEVTLGRLWLRKRLLSGSVPRVDGVWRAGAALVMAQVSGESENANALMESRQAADDAHGERRSISPASQHMPPTSSRPGEGGGKSCRRVCAECRARAAGVMLDSGTAGGRPTGKTAGTDPNSGGATKHYHHYHHDEEDRYSERRPGAEQGRHHHLEMDTEYTGDKGYYPSGGAGGRQQGSQDAGRPKLGPRCPPTSKENVNTPMEVTMDRHPHQSVFKDPGGLTFDGQNTINADHNASLSKTTKLCHVDSSSSIASLESSAGAKDKPSKAKRKKKLGCKKKLSGDAISEGEFDDTSSEHSISSLKPKKKARKCKKHCDKHSLKDAKEAPRDGTPTQDGDITNKRTDDVVCTCGKSSKKRMRIRPEPEGGSSHITAISAFMDEFDRVIFNNDPIFSDMEFDAKEDAQIRAEMERYHKRSNHPDIFSAAQMVNTNTMLKFAIIGAELQNISSVSLRRAEGEVQALTRRIRLLEEDFEQTETRLQSATEKLDEASKAADESERSRRALDNKQGLDEEKITMLEQMVKEATEAANEAERKYDEVVRKLLMAEADLERQEERAESAESKIKELEEELHVVTNNLRSLEISEEKASQREDSYEESIRDLTARLKDAENRATEAERTVSKLQKEVDRLEEELLDEKVKSKSMREEMESWCSELQGL